MIEESRTNLIPNSFDKGTWSAGSAGTLTRDAGIAPDGTMTATKASTTSNDIDVSPQLGNASAGATGQVAISGSTTYTLSIWAKASTTAQVGNNFKVRWKRVQGDNVFSETTFALTANWTRYSTTATTAANNTTVACYIGGVANSEALVWGAQLEAGSYVTSLIPTHGRSATRGSDDLVIDGGDFTDFINKSEGTILADYKVIGGDPEIMYLSNNNSNCRIGLYEAGSSQTRFLVNNAGTLADTTDSAGTTVGDNIKSAGAYKLNDVAASKNGVISSTDSSVTIPDGIDRAYIGGYYNGDVEGSLGLRRLVYYQQRLPNSQLVTLTA